MFKIPFFKKNDSALPTDVLAGRKKSAIQKYREKNAATLPCRGQSWSYSKVYLHRNLFIFIFFKCYLSQAVAIKCYHCSKKKKLKTLIKNSKFSHAFSFSSWASYSSKSLEQGF